MPTKTVTLVDIAKSAGVSRTVAGRVLLGSGQGVIRVAKETEERILSIARKQGYRPNRTAQQLAGGRSHVIGVVLATQAPDVTAARLAAIEQEAAKIGLRVIIGRFDQANPTLIHDYVDDFKGRHIEGIIFIDHSLWSRQAVFEIVGRLGSLPIVFQSQAELPASVARVRLDLGRGASRAVEYLVAKGHRRIGLAINGGQLPSKQVRELGFRSAMRECGLTSDPGSVWTPTSIRQQLSEEEIDAAIAQLVVGEKVTAIIAENDYWALQLISALEKFGARVPKDVAVLGYNNLAFSPLTKPSLTTFDEQPGKVAAKLVAFLDERIKARGKSKRPARPLEASVEPLLVERESA